MTEPLPAAGSGPLAEETRGIARNASIIALGNVTSRVLGFARDSAIAGLFGAGAHVDALTLAITIPNQIYDLVTGGVVNSALVPVFTEYASAAPRRSELWRLASIVLSLAALGVSLLVGALVVLTPQVVAVFAALGQGNNPQAAAQAAPLLRLTLPAVICLSLAGILSGLLYALQRFTLPAFTAAVFNLSMLAFSVALAGRLDVTATAVGLLVGAVLQVLLQLPGLGEGLAQLRPRLDLRHPGLRRILRLYVPIIGSLVVSQASIYIGLGLALGFVGGLSWMRYATTLYQFPLGLVAVAVSGAILPTLSRQAAVVAARGAAAPARRDAERDFKLTLVQGLNLVIVLIVPAAVGLLVLARPVVALAFEHGGRFTAADTEVTARVLQVFLLGLGFAAVDQVLVFAYYARQNTLTPALVGVFSVGVYVAVAVLGLPMLGLFSLMLADSLKQIAHALVTGGLLSRRLGGFRDTTFWPTLAKVVAASLVMAGLAAGARLLVQRLGLPPSLGQRLLEVAVPGLVGVVAYFGLAARLNIAEVRLAGALLRQRLGL